MNEKKENFSLKKFCIKHNAVLILLMLIVISSILSDVFLTSRNIFNILRQNTPIFLVSMGMLFVILTGGIDLSVGSIVAVGGMMISVSVVHWSWSSPVMLLVAVLFTLFVGFIIGAVNGFLISYIGVAPFVGTLGMMTIAKGIAYLITNGQPIRWPSDTFGTSFLQAFGSQSFLGIPWPVILGGIVFIICLLITKYTVFGRLVIATGSNQSAVTLAGINSKKYKFSVYAISGVCSALAGVVISCRSGTGTPSTGSGFELDAIAACVIGGASLNGGKGKVSSTLIGVLILALITNIMNLLSVPAYPQEIVKGVIILASVILQLVGTGKRQDIV